MKITPEMLRRANACPEHVKIFEQEWPDGAEVTLENVQRAADLGLDLDWFVYELFTVAAQNAYDEAVTVDRAAYYAARDAAQAVYTAAAEPAWAAYVQEKSAAWDAYCADDDYGDRESDDYAKYKEACKAACSAYHAATTPAYVACINAKESARVHYGKACARAFFETFELSSQWNE